MTLVILASLEIPLGILNAHNQRQDLRAKVAHDATAVATLSEDSLEHGRTNDPALRAVISRYAEATDGAVVIRDMSGHLVASSVGEDGGEAEAERVNGITVTTPIASRAGLLGTVRITYPTASTNRAILRYWLALALAAALVLAATTVAGLLLSRSLSRPLRRLENAAEQIGEGQLDARASESDGPEEIRRLARTLNETAAKLDALVRSQQDFVSDASHQLER
jgi:nitrogen fixation/metabolism regulation signal transduction histidine kinase